MSSSLPEIQQIPARHGTATFVPKGHIIKIINTYGRQVVDTWAFALPKPPSQQELDQENDREEEAKKAQKEGEKTVTEESKNNTQEEEPKATSVVEEKDESGQQAKEAETSAGAEEPADEEKKEEEDGEEVKEKEEAVGSKEKEGKEETEKQEEPGKPEQNAEGADKQEGEKKEAEIEEGTQKASGSQAEAGGEKSKDAPAEPEKPTSSKTGWTAYIPSIRSRGKSTSAEPPKAEQKKAEEKKKKTPAKAGEKRTWASYFSSGKGVSNYIPSKQLYDFSMTPVGAGALSAASGSGYAGTAYAAYQAYTKQQEKTAKVPQMEYLSMPHCHTATLHLVPQRNDTLVSNLRKPMLTVVEDTAAAHDTLIAACDPQRYRELNVIKWEEHGSCAENLVLALKEINQKAGLKGNKAIGTDVTVNTVPAPLNLFMNIPWNDGGTVSFEAPKGKKGEFIRLRAERDVVVVMSACPMDVIPVNGGKCMAAHFLVQEPEKKTPLKLPAAKKSVSASKRVPQTNANATPQKPAASSLAKAGTPVKRPSQQSAPTQNGASGAASQPQATNGAATRKSSTPQVGQPLPKPGRAKPKKLERRTPSQASTPRG